MHRSLRIAAAAGVAVCLVTGAHAADEARATEGEGGAPPGSDASRPRVGLVLGGGGARGGAHVGVLRVMEEMRIPVDYIAGTSIGSLVGALYAIGYSPDQIETVLQRVPWDEAFQDLPDRRKQSFRQKQDDRLAMFPFEMGFGKKGIGGKKGMLEGTRINFVFRSLTLDAGHIENFDELRIPYRAIAADLETADMVVLDHGDLAQAMRASMSVPGVFSPVEIDGRTLVDGGIARNIPVDVVRSMGADVVIAIDVGTPPRESVKDLSTFAVLSQTLAALAERNRRASREEIGPRDVLITPDLGNFGAGDFNEILTTVPKGEEAAHSHEADLRRYSVSEEEFARFLERQRRGGPGGIPQVRIDSVKVEGVTNIPQETILKQLDTKPGSVVATQTLYADLDKFYRIGEIESVGYRVVKTPNGNELVIEAKEKSYGPAYLRFGISINSDFEGDNSFNVTSQLRWPRINRMGAEWKSTFAFGNPLQLATEFYQPFSAASHFFVAPRLEWATRREETFLVNGDQEVIKGTYGEAGLDFGVRFSNYGEIRLGAVRGTADFEAKTTTDFDPEEHETGGPRLLAVFDQLDDVFFPTHGNRSSLEIHLSRDSWGADEEYDKLEFRSMQAFTLGRNTFVAWTVVGSSLGTEMPFFAQFPLGGLFNLSGFDRGSLRGNVAGLFSLADYWRLKRLGGLGKLYGGAAVQAGNTWPGVSEAAFNEMLYSGTLFLGMSTKAYPVYLGFGYGEGGHKAGYLVIGRAF